MKVVVIGLDGATWNIIKPLIDREKLPTFRKLIDNGIWGTLESTIPPVTGGAWLSLATGKTPGKTGIIDFLNKKDESNKLYPTTSSDFKGHSLWDYLSKANKKVGIFNYPMLFPPYSVNGFMVSGLGSSLNNDVTYPPSLKGELEQVAGKYEIYVNYHDKKYENLDLFILDLNKFLDKFEKWIYYLTKNKEWNFLFLVFSATDWMQHIIWRHIDETHPMYDPKNSPKYKQEFVKFWQRIDATINNILHIIPKETIVFLVSDHGFGPNDQTFNLLKWLELKKYLIKKINLKEDIKNICYNIVKLLIPNNAKRLIPLKARTKVGNILKKIEIINYINLEKSKVYCLGHTIPFGAIYINANNEEERSKIRSQLILDLGNLEEDIGKKLSVQIYEPRKIYAGDKVKLLPDIIFTINDWRCVIIEDSFSRPLFEEEPFSTRHTGSHRLNGIFLACGPGIKKGHKIESAKIYDIAPTILHIFSLPIPIDMDGRILTEIFEPDSEFTKRKPKYVDPSYYDQISERQKIRVKLNKIKTTRKL